MSAGVLTHIIRHQVFSPCVSQSFALRYSNVIDSQNKYKFNVSYLFCDSENYSTVLIQNRWVLCFVHCFRHLSHHPSFCFPL